MKPKSEESVGSRKFESKSQSMPPRPSHRKAFAAASEKLIEASGDESSIDGSLTNTEVKSTLEPFKKADETLSATTYISDQAKSCHRKAFTAAAEKLVATNTDESSLDGSLTDVKPKGKDIEMVAQPTPSLARSSHRKAFTVASENLVEASADESSMDGSLSEYVVESKREKKTPVSNVLAPLPVVKSPSPMPKNHGNVDVDEKPVSESQEEANSTTTDPIVSSSGRSSHRKAFTLASEKLAESSEDDSSLERPSSSVIKLSPNPATKEHEEIEMALTPKEPILKKKVRSSSGPKGNTKIDAPKSGKKRSCPSKVNAEPSSPAHQKKARTAKTNSNSSNGDVYAWNDNEDEDDLIIMEPLRKTPPKVKPMVEVKIENTSGEPPVSVVNGDVKNGISNGVDKVAQKIGTDKKPNPAKSKGISSKSAKRTTKPEQPRGGHETESDSEEVEDEDAPKCSSTKVACLANVFGRKSKSPKVTTTPSPQKKKTAEVVPKSPPRSQLKRRASQDLTVATTPPRTPKRVTGEGCGSSGPSSGNSTPRLTPKRRASHDAGMMSAASSPKRPTPSRRNSSESSASPATAPDGITKRRTTAEDLLFSAAIIGETSRRRRNSPALINCDPYVSGRTVFPLEVKLGAIERIQSGDPQATVARDLQVSVSTVASWWKAKEKLTMAQTKIISDKVRFKKRNTPLSIF